VLRQCGEIRRPSPANRLRDKMPSSTFISASLHTNADGRTVRDNITGLTWQRSPDIDGDGELTRRDKITFAQAQAARANSTRRSSEVLTIGAFQA